MSDRLSQSPLAKLQTQIPSHLARADLAELAVLLRHADQGAWAFAVYNTVPVRDEVASLLAELLAPLPVHSVSLSAQAPNPLDHLRRLSAGRRAVVFFFDLHETGGQVWGYLELQRENLAALGVGLVFWITPAERGQGVRRAPNFWSQRSGVFDFTIESPRVLADVRSAWAGQPVWLDSPEDWERQFRIYRGLLKEYEAGQAPPGRLADLHGKLAYLLDFAGRYDEAEQHLKQQLALAQTAGDKVGETEALNNLGRAAQMQRGRQAALTWYEQALVAAGDEPRSRADSLRNLASALYLEGESSRAFSLLTEALHLYRQVGDRLGEANISLMLGRLARQQGDLDAARTHAQTALSVYQTMDNAWNVALGLWDLGDVEQDAGDISEARRYYQAALKLLERIGAPAAATLRAKIEALA